MSNHGRPCFYYHCADISIQGDSTTPTPTSSPNDMTPVTATATLTPPLSCAGDCDDSGAVTINEIVALVGIAQDRRSIDRCEAGNTDGNEQITIDEILTAVDRALRGCGPDS